MEVEMHINALHKRSFHSFSHRYSLKLKIASNICSDPAEYYHLAANAEGVAVSHTRTKPMNSMK
jgi:hypothetical protein